MARATCLKQRMKQTVGSMVRVWKRAERERLFSLFGYQLTARRARAKNRAEFGEGLTSRTDEARVKLGGYSEDGVLCA